MFNPFVAPDYKMHRRRINQNPALSLVVFNQMKDECFGFAPSTCELSSRLLGIRLQERAAGRVNGSGGQACSS